MNYLYIYIAVSLIVTLTVVIGYELRHKQDRRYARHETIIGITCGFLFIFFTWPLICLLGGISTLTNRKRTSSRR